MNCSSPGLTVHCQLLESTQTEVHWVGDAIQPSYPPSSPSPPEYKVQVTQLCLTLCDASDYRVHGILQARILEWVAFPFSRGSSKLRAWTQVSRIAGGFFTYWAKGKPKNTGMGSLYHLQRIFPTQESNWGLLNCWWILYQLNYQGSLGYRIY